MPKGKDFMTVGEYAKRIGFSKKWVYELCRRRAIPHKKIGGPDGAIRIPLSALDIDVPALPREITSVEDLEQALGGLE